MKSSGPGIILLLIFVVLIKLCSCADGASKSNKVQPKDTLLEESIKAAADFNNRIIYKKLTVHIIDSIADTELLQVVLDNLYEKLPNEVEKEFGAVSNWPAPLQAIYVISYMEGEVNNGGHNQYYYNSSGQYYKLLPAALKLTGAEKFASLEERANATYEKEKNKITKYQDGSVEGFSKSYDDNPLDKFDDEFYALDKAGNLDKLLVAFIRKNKEAFVDK